MSDRPRGLGRGLSALIPTAARPAEAAESPFGRAAVGSVEPEALREGSPPPDASLTPEAASTPEAVDVAAQEELAAQAQDQPAVAEDSDERVGADAQDGSTGVPAVASYAELDPATISPNPRQPRTVFDEDAMAELVESIRTVGLLQPVVVRQTSPGSYELVMGERRWRAAQLAGLGAVPAIVRSTSDDDLLRDALLENLHRSELNPLEEAAAYDQLLQDFACTHEELSQRLGRSRPQISNTLRLLKLPAIVQRRLAAGVLSAGHARALLGLTDAAAQERLAQRIVAEGLSVRAVEEIVALGEAGEPAVRRKSLRAPTSPRLGEISERLSDRFETRVKVDLGRRKGKIVMEFASLDDLERILGLLEPPASPEQQPSEQHSPEEQH
ncbi:ParB family chromosome partitioning protein [Motilibacter peucedani]|uniref:ParB family chromosome partitioning protein n=1 Tax=Motilibacter peucedani TaxID=598650 RepID=A0A420XU48_9ACTN|nr:ParB/RepB/Spo0J family partition protein [Motilibacter peucedani]RKS80366.1 ParB family chromosome partitioning protein [Motilibacter peucedani]